MQGVMMVICNSRLRTEEGAYNRDLVGVYIEGLDNLQQIQRCQLGPRHHTHTSSIGTKDCTIIKSCSYCSHSLTPSCNSK